MNSLRELQDNFEWTLSYRTQEFDRNSIIKYHCFHNISMYYKQMIEEDYYVEDDEYDPKES